MASFVERKDSSWPNESCEPFVRPTFHVSRSESQLATFADKMRTSTKPILVRGCRNESGKVSISIKSRSVTRGNILCLTNKRFDTSDAIVCKKQEDCEAVEEFSRERKEQVAFVTPVKGGRFQWKRKHAHGTWRLLQLALESCPRRGTVLV